MITGVNCNRSSRLQIKLWFHVVFVFNVYLHSASHAICDCNPVTPVHGHTPWPFKSSQLYQIDRVYPLYFIAGPRLLAENAGEFFERVRELIEQRQIDRFTGLEKLDQTLVEFLLRSYQQTQTLTVPVSYTHLTLPTNREV